MKSVPKLIRRFVGIMILSILLLIILNMIFYAVVFVRNTSRVSAWDTADKAAAALQLTDTGYSMSGDMEAELKEENVWAVFIANETRQVKWHTENLPGSVPAQYTLSEIGRAHV